MKASQTMAAALAAALMGGTTLSLAAENANSGKPAMEMHGGNGASMGGGMGGMMGGGMGGMTGGGMGSGGKEGMGGMMGMMNMMGSCNRMMQGGAMGHALPQLPAGNEKLQLQMQAEMMQKMGETLAKYAARIK